MFLLFGLGLTKMFKRLIDNIKRRVNPIKYWKSLGAIIGKDCEIYPSANFGSEPYLISIGDHVRINSGVQLITHDGGVWVLRKLKRELADIDLIHPIIIGNNCHIGTNSIILPGVKIGNNVIIGVGSIVTKDIPDNSIVAGVPARVIETVDEYLSKHLNDFIETKHMNKKQKKDFLTNKAK